MPYARTSRRPVILDGAAELLESGLYMDLTVDALARLLHMSKSTLYRHFSSKEDVAIALVEDRCIELKHSIDEGMLDEGSTRDALGQLVELCARHGERLPRAALADADCMPVQCQRWVSESRDLLAQAFREILERGHARGELNTPDPALTAEALMASSWAAMCAAARGDILAERGEAVRAVLPLFRL